jgi:acetolactate synthase-1/2/3 large subunit
MCGQKARVVHIDIDHTEFGKHGHPSVNLLGDARKAVSRLICALGSDVPRISEWREEALSFKRRCQCKASDGESLSPRAVMCELNKAIDDSTIVTTDVGQNQMWAMHYLKIEHPRQFISSGTFGTMGFGLPSAIGAKAALPEKDVVAVTGDGGLQMVIQELSTSVEEDIPVTVVLLNNGKLGMVRQMQKHYRGKRYSGVDLGDRADFVAIAKGFGAEGVRIDRIGELGEAVEDAKKSGRTTLIEVKIDPEADILPMLPADPRVPIVKGYCSFRWKRV